MFSIRCITFAKEVTGTFSLVLVFLSLSRITHKLLGLIFTKFGAKVAHWTRKKPLNFGGILDHVTLWFELGLRLDEGTAILRMVRHVTQR